MKNNEHQDPERLCETVSHNRQTPDSGKLSVNDNPQKLSSTKSSEPLSNAIPAKQQSQIIIVLGLELIEGLQKLSAQGRVLETNAQTNGALLVQTYTDLVEQVEAANDKLRRNGVSQKAVSKASLVKLLVGCSKRMYEQNYYPLWEHREYLADETTEQPTSVRHANRIIRNYLSSQKRGESMAQSTQTKTAVLTLVAKLEAELKEAQITIQQLAKALSAKNDEVEKLKADLETKVEIMDQYLF